LYLTHNFFHVKVFNNKFVSVSSPIRTCLFLVDNLIINKSLSTLHNKKLQTMFCVFISITVGSCTRLKAILQFPVAQAQIKTRLYSWHNSIFG